MPSCKKCRRWCELVRFVHNRRFVFWIYQEEPFIDTYMAEARDIRVYECPGCEEREIERSTYDLQIQDDDEFCLN